jgi:uncharacterized protein
LNFKSISLFFIFVLSLGFQARAFDVPPLTAPVIDQAGLLSDSIKSQISQVLFEAHQNNGPQVQVLIVDSLDGLQIEEVAIKVFDQWKLGSQKESNGVLFLIAPKEKKLRIEVGRGLEGDIPDVIAKRIISDVVVPHFKQEDYNAGVVQGVQSILYYAKAKTSTDIQADQQERPHRKRGGFSLKWILGLWLLLFIFRPSWAIALLFSGRGRGGGGGWSGGGGGGWSGGGGGSAGGGASGGW